MRNPSRLGGVAHHIERIDVLLADSLKITLAPELIDDQHELLELGVSRRQGIGCARPDLRRRLGELIERSGRTDRAQCPEGHPQLAHLRGGGVQGRAHPIYGLRRDRHLCRHRHGLLPGHLHDPSTLQRLRRQKTNTQRQTRDPDQGRLCRARQRPEGISQTAHHLRRLRIDRDQRLAHRRRRVRHLRGGPFGRVGRAVLIAGEVAHRWTSTLDHQRVGRQCLLLERQRRRRSLACLGHRTLLDRGSVDRRHEPLQGVVLTPERSRLGVDHLGHVRVLERSEVGGQRR